MTQILSAKAKTEVFGSSEETGVKDQINANDVLLTIGLGGRWSVWSDMLMAVDLSYAKGMMEVDKATGGKSEGYLLAASL